LRHRRHRRGGKGALMIATMDLTNLLYVVGAIVGATLVSAFLLLCHRRPRSVDAGIENFSRELKALEPERRESGVSVVNRAVPASRPGDGDGRLAPRRSATGSGMARPGRAVTPLAPTRPAAPGGGDEAGASSSDGENEPG
jgi:hypothetical protein